MKRYGFKGLRILVQLFGLEETLRFLWHGLQKATGTHPDRRRAIRKAEQVDGVLGTALLGDGVHWVVFKDEQPVAAYPTFTGDLAMELRDYRRDQLKSPDALASHRAQAWFRERMLRVLKRDQDRQRTDAGSPSSAADGPSPAPGALSSASGADDFQRVVDQLEPLLRRLTLVPRAKVGDHPTIPSAPGIYLFSEGPNPIYVGQTRDLQQRLRQHTSPSSKENSAPLAFNLALRVAKAQNLDTTGSPEEIAARPEFNQVFRAARERVGDMDVRFIELDDPVTRTVFEVYAARALGTDELNDWETP